MRTFKLLLLSASILFLPITLLAQSNMEDVVYLKDGSIYRGMIIEQVPNVSLKIKTLGGNVFAVQLSEVEKLTREKTEVKTLNAPWSEGFYPWHHFKRDTIPFVTKQHGYFLQSQVMVENMQGGLHIINGYKFGQFGYLGVGVGFDYVYSSPLNPKMNGLEKKALAGLYLPLYIYYAGDLHKKRFTPFYALEAGYVIAFQGMDGKFNTDDAGRRASGGPMGGLGLGIKFNSRHHRGHFSLLFNINYKYIRYETDFITLNGVGEVIDITTAESSVALFFPGLRFGIGF